MGGQASWQLIQEQKHKEDLLLEQRNSRGCGFSGASAKRPKKTCSTVGTVLLSADA